MTRTGRISSITTVAAIPLRKFPWGLQTLKLKQRSWLSSELHKSIHCSGIAPMPSWAWLAFFIQPEASCFSKSQSLSCCSHNDKSNRTSTVTDSLQKSLDLLVKCTSKHKECPCFHYGYTFDSRVLSCLLFFYTISVGNSALFPELRGGFRGGALKRCCSTPLNLSYD